MLYLLSYIDNIICYILFLKKGKSLELGQDEQLIYAHKHHMNIQRYVLLIWPLFECFHQGKTANLVEVTGRTVIKLLEPYLCTAPFTPALRTEI